MAWTFHHRICHVAAVEDQYLSHWGVGSGQNTNSSQRQMSQKSNYF